MALTRKLLKGMGLTDEQVDTIIEAHTDTVDGLKSDISKYKADAEKLTTVQRELDDLKAKGDDGWKDKHDKVKREFDNYKNGVESEKSKAAKEKAARAYFEGKNIIGKSLELAMRASAAEIAGLELDGENIKDTAALDGLIAGDLSGLVGSTSLRGSNPATPPANTGGSKLTREDIYKKDEKGRYIMSTSERQKALAENPNLM